MAAAVAAVAAAALAAGAHAAPADAAPRGPDVDASAWTLIDAESGEPIASKRPRRVLPVASATKLMTTYVALRTLPLSKRVEAPPYEAIPVESVLGLQAGERIKVRDLLYALILASANDGAVAVAEAVSGNVPDFVAEMNRTAQVLGLGDTSFANPIGLDEPGNASSARDLAALARLLLAEPVFRRIADTKSRTIQTDLATRTIETRNTLLGEARWVNGVKTGHTLGAGHVLVGSGTRRGVTLIAVVLGAPSEEARNAGTLKLLRYGFKRYPREPAVEESADPAPAPAPGEPASGGFSLPGWTVALAALAFVIVILMVLTGRTRAPQAQGRFK
jgi:D-alanyl-D-alanine carboxypeptidase (penicillin-binding protein 5/6)